MEGNAQCAFRRYSRARETIGSSRKCIFNGMTAALAPQISSARRRISNSLGWCFDASQILWAKPNLPTRNPNIRLTKPARHPPASWLSAPAPRVQKKRSQSFQSILPNFNLARPRDTGSLDHLLRPSARALFSESSGRAFWPSMHCAAQRAAGLTVIYITANSWT